MKSTGTGPSFVLLHPAWPGRPTSRPRRTAAELIAFGRGTRSEERGEQLGLTVPGEAEPTDYARRGGGPGFAASHAIWDRGELRVGSGRNPGGYSRIGSANVSRLGARQPVGVRARR